MFLKQVMLTRAAFSHNKDYHNIITIFKFSLSSPDMKNNIGFEHDFHLNAILSAIYEIVKVAFFFLCAACH